MTKYRKKPVIIEAVQWTGKNIGVIKKFVGVNAKFHYYVTEGDMNSVSETPPSIGDYGIELTISTLEGDMQAKIGDYIIKGVSGEFYPCKPDIFEKTYEPVEEC